MTLKQRFEQYIFYSPDGCHYWIGALNNLGYGRFMFAGKNRFAHRVAYLIYKDESPEGLLVCHSCDNPTCVNPDHLFLGTNQDNSDDKIRKGRKNKTHKSIIKDITGQRFGRLTALRLSKITAYHNAKWIVRCDCGIEKEVFSIALTRGTTKSCGCWRSEVIKLSNQNRKNICFQE